MRRQWVTIIVLVLVSGLLVSGCVRKAAVAPPPPKPAAPEQQVQQQRQEEEAGPPRVPSSMKVEKPKVKVADPKGRWTFEAQAETMTAASANGPYTMRRATGRYERKGQPPVTMRADQIVVDQGTRHATLTGSVHLESPTMQVDAPRVVYDLDTQQVHATGPTKGVYARPPVARAP